MSNRTIDTTAAITWVARTAIHPCATQPRKHFDDKRHEELRCSMRQHGFFPAWPLAVRPLKDHPGEYEIVFGEQRWRAAGAEEIELVPVVIDAQMDDKRMFELQVVENVQRAALTPVEEARAYSRMRNEFAYTMVEIADKIGLNVTTVKERISMLRAPEEMLLALDRGEIGHRQCVLVAGVPDAKLREQCAKQVLLGERDHSTNEQKPLTVVQTKRHIRTHYMVGLKGAAWSLDDATLVPEVGACNDCPFLAKNNPDVQDELQSGGGGKGGIEPLTCCNPTCHGRKMDAQWKVRQAAAKSTGDARVLSKDEADKNLHQDGSLRYNAVYVRLDDKPGYDITGKYDDSKTPTFRKLIKDAGANPQIAIARAKDGGIIELVPKKAAIELAKSLKAGGKLKKDKPTAAELKEKEKVALDNKVSAAVKVKTLEVFYRRIQAVGIGLDEQRAILDTMMTYTGMDGLRLMSEWLCVQPEKPAKKGEQLNQDHYRDALMASLQGATKVQLEAMTVVAFMAKNVKQGWALDYFVKPLMKTFGVEHKEIKAAAVTEVKEAIEAKKAKASKKAPPEKPNKKRVNDGMAAGTTLSGVAVETVYDASKDEEVTSVKAAKPGKPLVPSGNEDEVAALLKEWAVLKKPTHAEGKDAKKTWDAARKRISRALVKLGAAVPAK